MLKSVVVSSKMLMLVNVHAHALLRPMKTGYALMWGCAGGVIKGILLGFVACYTHVLHHVSLDCCCRGKV